MMRRRGNAKIVIIVVLAVIGGMFLSCAGVAALLLLPAIAQARLAAQRMHSTNNMKEISLALHNYHDTYRSFPPAYISDAEGKPMHSWRVLILPFLGEEARYDSYDFDQPWDSPHNLKVAERTPPVYLNAAQRGQLESKGLTTYKALVGPKTVINPEKAIRFSEISNGTSDTVMTVEETTLPVFWSEPVDISPQAFLSKDFSQQTFKKAIVGIVDGSVVAVSESEKGQLQGMTSIDGS